MYGESTFCHCTATGLTRLLSVGCCVCVLYDHLTTLDLENRRKWSIVQMLFLIVSNLEERRGHLLTFFGESIFGRCAPIQCTSTPPAKTTRISPVGSCIYWQKRSLSLLNDADI
ncbi:hypothetical protein BJ165DRAFT_1399810 [Panaeolus papilionaceus]|nr:hypothetical protein BJ165DRAFT_1399810 [Panaeolus papilionaceus]